MSVPPVCSECRESAEESTESPEEPPGQRWPAGRRDRQESQEVGYILMPSRAHTCTLYRQSKRVVHDSSPKFASSMFFVPCQLTQNSELFPVRVMNFL